MSEVIYASLARGDGSFGPGDIALLTAGLEAALGKLDITNRDDPATTLVAKLIIQLARTGKRVSSRLAKIAIDVVRESSYGLIRPDVSATAQTGGSCPSGKVNLVVLFYPFR